MAYSRIAVELVGGHGHSGGPLDTIQSGDGGEVTLASLVAGDKVVLIGGMSGEVATVTRLDMDADGTINTTTQLSPE